MITEADHPMTGGDGIGSVAVESGGGGGADSALDGADHRSSSGVAVAEEVGVAAVAASAEADLAAAAFLVVVFPEADSPAVAAASAAVVPVAAGDRSSAETARLNSLERVAVSQRDIPLGVARLLNNGVSISIDPYS